MDLTKAQLHVFAHLDEVRGVKHKSGRARGWIVWELKGESVTNEVNALKRRGMVKIYGESPFVVGFLRVEENPDWMLRLLEGYSNGRRT